MRFSLRGLLLATAYVALVAGAIGSRSALLADAVWLVSIAVTFYAGVVAGASTGVRRATAIGFVVWFAAYFAGLYFIPNRMPANQLLTALGNNVSGGLLYVIETAPSATTGLQSPVTFIADSGAIVSTANAVGAMVSGWIGFGLATLAYLQSKRE
jgi:hypothetical protein